MRLLYLLSLLVLFGKCITDDVEKYRPIREQCQRTPSNSECLKLKSKFLELIKKCQKLTSQQQVEICKQVKTKLCFVFPTTCGQISPTSPTTRRTPTKSKLIITPPPITFPHRTTKSKLIVTQPAVTFPPQTTKSIQNDEEFVKVPVNPDDLRTRGEYCIRHGKEKKCQQLLTNLKATYSSCNKKKSPALVTKPEELDCHSFQTHLCKAFPKFPPCIKKTSK